MPPNCYWMTIFQCLVVSVLPRHRGIGILSVALDVQPVFVSLSLLTQTALSSSSPRLLFFRENHDPAVVWLDSATPPIIERARVEPTFRLTDRLQWQARGLRAVFVTSQNLSSLHLD